MPVAPELALIREWGGHELVRVMMSTTNSIPLRGESGNPSNKRTIDLTSAPVESPARDRVTTAQNASVEVVAGHALHWWHATRDRPPTLGPVGNPESTSGKVGRLQPHTSPRHY